MLSCTIYLNVFFSSKKAYLSNQSRADFVYDGTPYASTEQGLHHLGAAHHLDFDLAECILKKDDTGKVKDMSHKYPRSAEWERIAPHKLHNLNREKFKQNPYLRARLISTEPHPLIKALIDKK